MIQYGYGRNIIGGNPEEVERAQIEKARQAAESAERFSSFGTLALAGLAAWWWFKGRKKTNGGAQ